MNVAAACPSQNPSFDELKLPLPSMSRWNGSGVQEQDAALAVHVLFWKHPKQDFEQSDPPPPENWNDFAGMQNPHLPSGNWFPPPVWNSQESVDVLAVFSQPFCANASVVHRVPLFFSHALQFESQESLANPNSHMVFVRRTPVESMYDFVSQFPPTPLHFVSSLIASNDPFPDEKTELKSAEHLLLANLQGRLYVLMKLLHIVSFVPASSHLLLNVESNPPPMFVSCFVVLAMQAFPVVFHVQRLGGTPSFIDRVSHTVLSVISSHRTPVVSLNNCFVLLL